MAFDKKEYNKQYRLRNRDEINRKQRLRYLTPEYKEKQKIYREKNKLIIAAKAKIAHQLNKDKINARRRVYMSNPEVKKRYYEKHREWQYKRNYGICTREYNQMLKEQGEKCWACGEKSGGKKLHVDHCHTTGKVRKLLCTNCNTAFGLLKENINTMTNLINLAKGNI